jgi:uncharacterized protein YdhG (YjbR/CyaY superfamily)
MSAQAVRDVDAYVAEAPEVARPLLTELRELIRDAVPEAEERISYGMPSYRLNGVRLTYFQAHMRHIGLYAFNADDVHAVGLDGYLAAKSTLQFALDQPLPASALRRLIQQRVNAIAAQGGAQERRARVDR